MVCLSLEDDFAWALPLTVFGKAPHGHTEHSSWTL